MISTAKALVHFQRELYIFYGNVKHFTDRGDHEAAHFWQGLLDIRLKRIDRLKQELAEEDS